MAADDTQDARIEHAEPIKYKPVELRFMRERGYLGPDFALAMATGANTGANPGWWVLDDIIIKFGTTDTHKPSKLFMGDWTVVPTSTLADIESAFIDLGVPGRLKVRKLPTA